MKLIDVYPDEVGRDPKMGGYQLMISADILRGRYRDSFSDPQPIPSGKTQVFRFALPTANHVFLPGHRVMVQVQSSWFPLYDRNPQSYVPNIFFAKPSDYQKATIKLFDGAGALASFVEHSAGKDRARRQASRHGRDAEQDGSYCFSCFSGFGFGASFGAGFGAAFMAAFGAPGCVTGGGAWVRLVTGAFGGVVCRCAGTVGRVPALTGGVCAGVTGLSGGAPLAPTTPGPLKAAGRAVAAMAGCPPLALAESCGLRRASCTCWLCAAVGGVCGSFIAVLSAGVGWAVTPPGPL